jgi:O-antigen ligase
VLWRPVTTVSIPPSTHPPLEPESAAAAANPLDSGSPIGRDIAGFASALTLVVVMSAHNGSYFSTSWGWQAMALLGLGITGLVFMVSVCVFRLQALFLAGVSGFVAWVGISSLWTNSVPGSVRELERDVVYVGLALALGIFGRYLSARGLALGLLAGISTITAYALTTRLFPTHFAAPDPISAYQLSVPLGYWNALGLLAAMGMVLSLGVAGQANNRVVRMAAGASICVIVPAMLFTFSRGAWVAAAIGLVAMLALDPHRIALTAAAGAIAFPVGCLVWLGATSGPLTDVQATVAEAAHSGRRYFLAVILLACVSAVLVELAHRVVIRFDPGPAAEHRFGIGIGVAALAAVCALVIAHGGPVKAADRGWAAFNGGFSMPSDNLSDRFRSFSNNGRIEHWRVALDDYREHPVFGSGAGTYEQAWYLLRRNDLTVRDAHSLYLEVLAELGPLGLLFLFGTMAVPLVAFVRSRAVPYVPAAGGSFVAFAAHAGIDWDWEVVGLTATAILAATVGLVAAGARDRPLTLGRQTRVAGVAVAGAIAVFAFVSFVGNREVAASQRSLTSGSPEAAIQSARRATRTLRWSVEPWLALGYAQRARNDAAGARVSFEHATMRDAGNWRAWLALSEVSVGAEHRKALANFHRLNPRGVDPSAG